MSKFQTLIDIDEDGVFSHDRLEILIRQSGLTMKDVKWTWKTAWPSLQLMNEEFCQTWMTRCWCVRNKRDSYRYIRLFEALVGTQDQHGRRRPLLHLCNNGNYGCINPYHLIDSDQSSNLKQIYVHKLIEDEDVKLTEAIETLLADVDLSWSKPDHTALVEQLADHKRTLLEEDSDYTPATVYVTSNSSKVKYHLRDGCYGAHIAIKSSDVGERECCLKCKNAQLKNAN